MALIYEESARALDRQQAVVESLRTRAGVLIAAASVATTFLGRRAVDGHAAWTCLDWYAVGCFVGVAVLSLFILVPRRGWFYTHNVDLLCERYDHHQEWATLGGMHRRLADANQSNAHDVEEHHEHRYVGTEKQSPSMFRGSVNDAMKRAETALLSHWQAYVDEWRQTIR